MSVVSIILSDETVHNRILKNYYYARHEKRSRCVSNKPRKHLARRQRCVIYND